MGRSLVASVEDPSTGMKRNPICFSDLGISGDKHDERTRITMLPVCLDDLWVLLVKRSHNFEEVEAVFFVAATILTQPGYFLHLD